MTINQHRSLSMIFFALFLVFFLSSSISSTYSSSPSSSSSSSRELTKITNTIQLQIEERTRKRSPPSWPQFRSMSYNIRSGSNISDIYNLTATATAINEFNVDFVGLQEVDNDTSRHPGQDQPLLLGQLTNMSYAFGIMRYFEGGFFGIAALSRLPILDIQIFRYSNPNSSSSSSSSKGWQSLFSTSSRSQSQGKFGFFILFHFHFIAPSSDCQNPDFPLSLHSS
jgi:hypothetical protein